MKLNISLFASALLLAFASLIGMSQAAAYQQGFNVVTSTGTVYRVVDADTFIINLDDSQAYQQLVREAKGDEQRTRYLNDRFSSIRIRLANVDTPESVHPQEDRNTAEGKALSATIKDAMEGQRTQVSCYDWGDNGRLICTVATPGGGDLGQWLIRNGHSDYVTAWGRNPFFDEAYRQAAQ